MTWSASWEPIGAEVYGGDFATYDEALSELIFALRHAGLVWCGWLVDWSFFWRLPGFEKHDIQYDTFFVAGNYWSLETFQFSKIHKKNPKHPTSTWIFCLDIMRFPIFIPHSFEIWILGMLSDRGWPDGPGNHWLSAGRRSHILSEIHPGSFFGIKNYPWLNRMVQWFMMVWSWLTVTNVAMDWFF